VTFLCAGILCRLMKKIAFVPWGICVELSANSDYYHIVYIDRTNIPDTKPVTGTLKLSQVRRYIQLDPVSNYWRLSTAELPYSYPSCRLNPNNITGCNIDELKGELRLRGLKLGGRKAKLIERLSGAFSAEYNDGNEGGDKVNVTVDGANPHPPHENPGAKDAL